MKQNCIKVIREELRKALAQGILKGNGEVSLILISPDVEKSLLEYSKIWTNKIFGIKCLVVKKLKKGSVVIL